MYTSGSDVNWWNTIVPIYTSESDIKKKKKKKKNRHVNLEVASISETW